MNVAGIDFSSHSIDVVLIDIDGHRPPLWHRYPLAGPDAFDRARRVPEEMPGPRSCYWDDTLAIGIEEPAGKFKPGGGYRVQGAVLACLPPRLLVVPWMPSQWRKAVGLPGNASKADVAAFACVFGDDWPQDACDAYCIAAATTTRIVREVAA